MFDLGKELQNFKMIDLKTLEDRDLITSDSIRNSIILFNKAINNLRTKSEDIAIIELKKAISLNPEFTEAVHLLGICYGICGDYNKAEETFKKLSATDKGYEIACAYLDKINGLKSGDKLYHERSNRMTKDQKPESSNTSMKKTPANHSIVNCTSVLLRTETFKYAATFLAGAGIVFILFIAFQTKQGEIQAFNKIENVRPSTVDTDAIKKLEDKNKQLVDSNNELQKNLEATSSSVDYYKNVDKLFEIEKFALAKEYEAAADKLMLLKTVEFKDTAKAKYDSLYGDIMQKAIWAVYTQGNNLFEASRYQEAIPKLYKIQAYGVDWQYMAWTLYQLGISYKEVNDKNNAITVFNQIKEKYPTTEYARYAEYRVKELSSIQ